MSCDNNYYWSHRERMLQTSRERYRKSKGGLLGPKCAKYGEGWENISRISVRVSYRCRPVKQNVTAMVTFNEKLHHLGTFHKLEEAQIAVYLYILGLD